MISHQDKQREVIDKIAEQVSNNSLEFSTVAPVEDYESDPRICLTSVHIPRKELIDQVQNILEPLRKIEPNFFYYPEDSFHLTIKNVRVINDPPKFGEAEIAKAKKVFSKIVPDHTRFQIYFYRLLMFPNNLALIGTTDPELDNIVLDLDRGLKSEGVADDKTYINSKYFFSNMTLARFNNRLSSEFIKKVNEISESLKFEPYLVDSITLVTCNAVFKRRNEVGSWKMKE